MALAFHGAQHIIPRGEYLGPPAEHGGVLRKARGVGLAAHTTSAERPVSSHSAASIWARAVGGIPNRATTAGFAPAMPASSRLYSGVCFRGAVSMKKPLCAKGGYIVK